MSGDEGTFCCLTCRLLQDATFECRECGAQVIAALKFENDVLRQPPTPRRSKAKNAVIQTAAGVGVLGGYVGTIVAGVLISPIVPAAVLVGALGTASLVIRHNRRQITTVQPLAPQTSEHAVTKQGIAHRLVETVTSIDGDEQVLCEEAILRGKSDGVLFRRTRAARFLVELEGGDRLLVDGIVRVAARAKRLVPPAKPGDPRLVALGIEGVPAGGPIDVAVIRDGDAIEVTGEVEVEAIQELAVDRDGGETRVMRGRAKSVVLIRVR